MTATTDALDQLVQNTTELLETVTEVNDTFKSSKSAAVNAAIAAGQSASDADGDRILAESAKTIAQQYRNEAQNAAQSAASIAFQTGTITTDSRFGVTITHNKGDLDYTPKASIIGTAAQAMKAGEVSFVLAANTVVIYNTGDPVAMQYELSGVAP